MRPYLPHLPNFKSVTGLVLELTGHISPSDYVWSRRDENQQPVRFAFVLKPYRTTTAQRVLMRAERSKEGMRIDWIRIGPC
jgi:hypothetical protein